MRNCIQLPHRGFDGHIRVSSYEGESTSKAEPYANARNSTLENLLPLFDLSPETVIFGGWDSTRSKNQLRIPSILVGETYAVLAEQNGLSNICLASVLVVGSLAGAAESFIATFGRIQFVDWLELHVRVW